MTAKELAEILMRHPEYNVALLNPITIDNDAGYFECDEVIPYLIGNSMRLGLCNAETAEALGDL